MKNPFMLKVDQSYLSGKNEEAAEVYIIDPSNNEVYVEGLGKDLTEEELEAMEDMSAEEIDDFLGLDEVEEPIHEINFFERTEDSIVLEYDEEKLIFTELSETIFEDEAGIRYYLEENTTIADYEESLQGN